MRDVWGFENWPSSWLDFATQEYYAVIILTWFEKALDQNSDACCVHGTPQLN